MKIHLKQAFRDLNTANERFEQFKSAYCSFSKAQRYLQKGGLDLDILTKAFRGLSNLERVTYDRSNVNIGFTQLTHSFGDPRLLREELLTFDDFYTLPTLVRALSESKTKVTVLHIGCSYDVSERRFKSPRIINLSWLTTNALIAAFCHADMCAHASQVMSNVQSLVIDETDVADSRHDLLTMAAVIKHMTNLSPKLERIEIGEISSSNYSPNMQLLTIEDLFELQGVYHLQQIGLTHLKIPSCRSIVAFLRHHACTVVNVRLVCVELMVDRYIYFPSIPKRKTITNIHICIGGHMFSINSETSTSQLWNGSIPNIATTSRAKIWRIWIRCMR